MLTAIILIIMILFAALLGISGGGLGDYVEGYTMVGELIQCGKKQILIGHTNNEKLLEDKKSFLNDLDDMSNDELIDSIADEIDNIGLKAGVDINKYRSNTEIIHVLYMIYASSENVILCNDPTIKELFDYKKIMDYSAGIYHHPVEDVIRIGNIIISFDPQVTFYFDSNVTNDIYEIPNEIKKYKDSKEIRYWNIPKMMRSIIMGEFRDECLSVPFILNTGRSLFGVHYAATSQNIVILGEKHMSYNAIKNKSKPSNEGLLQEMPNYIKELNAEMHRRDKMATFYVELFSRDKPNIVSSEGSYNLTSIIETFRDNKFTNLKLRYLDIRHDEHEDQVRLYKIFDEKSVEDIFHALVFSENLMNDLERFRMAKSDLNIIKEIFSVEHPGGEGTPYKQYIRGHPFLTRTAYEFMRLRSSDQQSYDKIKKCYKKQ